MASCGRNWRVVSGSVLAYEGVAAVTKALKDRGVTDHDLPFITELIRQLPRSGRVAATAVVAVVVHDHFDTRRVFG